MKKLLKLKKSEKGQGLVEFAIILPILLLLIMGIIQFSIIISAQVTITNAAREAVRSSALSISTDDDIKENIKDSLETKAFFPAKQNIIVDITGTETVTVKISVNNFEIIVPVPDVFLPGSKINLTADASMRKEK